MKLILLGTAGYHPNDHRQTACLMVPEAGIVLDAGTAFYRVRDYLCTTDLDVFVTHAHLDHVVGLTYLFDVIRDQDVRRVTVHGMAEKLTAIQNHLLAEPLFPVRLPCEFRPLRNHEPLVGGGRMTHFPVDHPGGAVGFRLDWPGHSLAYVTDTTATETSRYLPDIRGVDLLVHECNFADDKAALAATWGHSAVGGVESLAQAAGVGRLVLVHVDPITDGADLLRLRKKSSVYTQVQLGHDRMEIDF